MTEPAPEKKVGRRIPPLVWIIVALLLAWLVVAAVLRGGREHPNNPPGVESVPRTAPADTSG
mgnify:CR=1 FL=1